MARQDMQPGVMSTRDWLLVPGSFPSLKIQPYNLFDTLPQMDMFGY